MGISGTMFKIISEVDGWLKSGLSKMGVDTILKIVAEEKVNCIVIRAKA